MELKQIIVLGLQLSIVCTVLGFGLRATLADLTYLVRRPRLLARSLLAVYVLMPLVVIALDLAFDFRRPVEVLLVALAISPLPPLLPRKEAGAGGQVSYGLGLMAVLAIASIALVPLSLEILQRLFGRELGVPIGTLAGIVVKTTLGPLLAGVAFRRLMPEAADRLAKPVTILGAVVLAVGALVLVAGSLSAIWDAIGDGTLLAMAMVSVAGLAIGHFLGGPHPNHSVVLALATACRHPAIALTIATTNFPDHRYGGILLLYLVVSAIVAIPYLKWQRRPSISVPATAAPPAR